MKGREDMPAQVMEERLRDSFRAAAETVSARDLPVRAGCYAEYIAVRRMPRTRCRRVVHSRWQPACLITRSRITC